MRERERERERDAWLLEKKGRAEWRDAGFEMLHILVRLGGGLRRRLVGEVRLGCGLR